VLTGKGNIKDSRINAREVSEAVIRDYIGLNDVRGPSDPLRGAHDTAKAAASSIVQSAIRRAKVSAEKLENIAHAIEGRWNAVGYDGDYARWMDRNRPLT
jgi:hypothetical protein